MWVISEFPFLFTLHLGGFSKILVYATLIQLVGLCAAIVPFRKPELFRAGATQCRFIGVPVITIAGVGAVLS